MSELAFGFMAGFLIGVLFGVAGVLSYLGLRKWKNG